MKEPFESIMNPPEFPNMPTSENRRIKSIGMYVTGGGGGVLMMWKDWESVPIEKITWERRLEFYYAWKGVEQYLVSLKVPVDIGHAKLVKSMYPEYRFYWVPTEEEVL